jgi:histidinol-phosphate/aromatic aminotransferase/cobyric acid decarboxylase-like protein
MNENSLHPAAQTSSKEFTLTVATETDRQQIYRLRHDIYALELAQHSRNEEGLLTDALDAFNHYLVVRQRSEIAGFISITPPGEASYSIDKYVAREQLPFPVDGQTYEVRILTVIKQKRGWELAPLLMYSALRWVESHGGTRIMAIGRKEILSLYRKAGLQSTGLVVQSGQVSYEVMHNTVESLRKNLESFSELLDKLESKTGWQLDFSFRKPAACFHGGMFFKEIGETFSSLHKSETIINADVLDAWFPPSPKVLAALQEYLPWLVRTSPPADACGLVEKIAQVRGVAKESVLPGAGSSDLIFLAFRHWLDCSSRVLILDPTYGEYPHILEQVIRCRVDRLPLRRENNYDVDWAKLESALEKNYDWVVLVNPNSPTGRHIQRDELEKVIEHSPQRTRFWVDETYIEYIGGEQSLEKFAARSSNVVVCKSMSKVYALSGLRVAYLCAAPPLLEELRSFTPPWAVSLLAQVAGVHALLDPDYYAARYAETHRFREELALMLQPLRWNIVPSQTNFLLAHLPEDGPDASTVVEHCRRHGLFLRNAASMGTGLNGRAIRIAVKDAAANHKMVEILKRLETSIQSL